MGNTNVKKQIVHGMLWKFGERIIAQGVSFIVSVVLSRILLPEDFGVVAIVLIFISLANVFVTSGFSTALVQNKEANDVDFSTNFYCSLVVSVIVYFILFFSAPAIALFNKMNSLVLIIRFFSLRIPISTFSAIQHAYVERHMLFKRFFFSTLFGTIISGVVGIVLAYLNFGVWALIAQYFTNTIVDIIVLLFSIPWRPRLLFSIKSAKSMMNYGWKILFSDLSGTFFNQLRSLMIGKYYTSSDLAYYNKGKQLPDLITTNICSSLMTVLFPAMSNINDDIDKVRKMTRKSTKVISFVMYPLLFGLICVAEPLILVLFTAKWSDSIVFVRLLCLASIFNLMSSISLQAIKALGRSDLILKMEIVKKPIYVLLLVLGIRINVIFVAITMAVYNMVENLVNSVCLSRIMKYSLISQIKDIFRPLIMSIIMCACIYPICFLQLNRGIILAVQVLLGGGIYVLISYHTKEESLLTIIEIIKKRNENNT